jgi:hypothetical protein
MDGFPQPDQLDGFLATFARQAVFPENLLVLKRFDSQAAGRPAPEAGSPAAAEGAVAVVDEDRPRPSGREADGG